MTENSEQLSRRFHDRLDRLSPKRKPIQHYLKDIARVMPNLEITTYEFPYFLEVLATIAWATSGALVARAFGFDFMGVFIIALVSTTAGGLVRDGIFLQRIPVMLTNSLYMVIAFFAAVVISLFGRYWEKVKRGDAVIGLIDAIGTPAFALIGFPALLPGRNPDHRVIVRGVGERRGWRYCARPVRRYGSPVSSAPDNISVSILIVCLLLYVALLGYGQYG